MPFGLPYAGDGSRITDLILRAGDIRARGAAERGDILGQTISGLGQLAGQTFADAQEQQRKKAAAAAEGEFITAAQQEGFDINAALRGMAPELRPQAMAIYSKLEDAKAQRDARRQEAEKRKAEIAQLEAEAQEHDDYRNALGADVLLNALGTPGEANARNAVLGYFAQEDPETIAQIKDLPGEQLRPILERFRSGSKKFEKEVAELADKKARAQLDREKFEEEKRQFGVTSKETGRHNVAMENKETMAMGPDVGDLSPEALAVGAQMLAQTGISPLGMSKNVASLNVQMLNEAAKNNPDLNIALAKAGYRADTGSLAKLQAQTDAVTAFEKTADDNARLLKEIAKDIPNLRVRFGNRRVRELAGQFGSVQMAKFDAIRQSVQNEYARIISNPNLTGVMSDTARKEAEQILSPDATVAQIEAALDTLKREATNRRVNYEGQLKAIRQRIGGPASSGQPKKVGQFEVVVEP